MYGCCQKIYSRLLYTVYYVVYTIVYFVCRFLSALLVFVLYIYHASQTFEWFINCVQLQFHSYILLQTFWMSVHKNIFCKHSYTDI